MQNSQEVRKALDNTLDWLSEQPEEYIRAIFTNNRIPRNVDFILEMGNTEYTIVSRFKPDNAEDIVRKIIRLLEGCASV